MSWLSQDTQGATFSPGSASGSHRPGSQRAPSRKHSLRVQPTRGSGDKDTPTFLRRPMNPAPPPPESTTPHTSELPHYCVSQLVKGFSVICWQTYSDTASQHLLVDTHLETNDLENSVLLILKCYSLLKNHP